MAHDSEKLDAHHKWMRKGIAKVCFNMFTEWEEERQSSYWCHRWVKWGLDGRLVFHGWPGVLFSYQAVRKLEAYGSENWNISVWGKNWAAGTVFQCCKTGKKNIRPHVLCSNNCPIHVRLWTLHQDFCHAFFFHALYHMIYFLCFLSHSIFLITAYVNLFRLTVRAECPMHLEDFPMDAHACPLKFGSCK